MKKQIFSLLLSAALFTRSPLFAMDPQLESGEEADPFRAAYLSQQDRQDVEITPEELKFMSLKLCDNANVPNRVTFPRNVLAYRFSMRGQPYELQISARKYIFSLHRIDLLENDDQTQIYSYLENPYLFEDVEADRIADLAEKHVLAFENVSPDVLLEELISQDKTITFSRVLNDLETWIDSRYSLPVAFHVWGTGFHMAVRTKYPADDQMALDMNQ